MVNYEQYPHMVTEEQWTTWIVVWQSEGWKARALKNKDKKNSDLAGPGTGTTKHIAGSRSYAAHEATIITNLFFNNVIHRTFF